MDAWEFQDSNTWRITKFKGYLKIEGCGCIGIEDEGILVITIFVIKFQQKVEVIDKDVFYQEE